MKKIPSEFVSKMSHDLKTPVGNAMMYVELLIDDIDTIGSEHPELKDKLEDLKNSCRSIYLSSSKLINAIQSWSYAVQIEDGEFHLKKTKINLSNMLSDVIENNSMFIRGKSLDIETIYNSNHQEYDSDFEIMRLLLDNLMTLFISLAGNKEAVRIEAVDDGDGLLFRFFATKTAFNKNLIQAYTGKYSIKEQVAPDQGILKPGGYSLMFCNIALRFIGAAHGVDENNSQSRSYWFRLPLP